MLILPETDCLVTMASSIEPCNLPKIIDSDLSSPPKSINEDVKPKDLGTRPQRLSSISQQRRHQQQKEFMQHQQRPRQPHHNWDINDSTIPVPEMYDPFDVWPSGHCRRVYRGEVDDARRHISGWAMRNTNNHNALILKKSCLGVLVCSNDCALENGRKVHLRPAICDKARRKQMGKSCPNPDCCGKLTLHPCRGHCGYPVTHFWRQVKGTVFFQAKGYHDHPRPDIKSLSEKGRNALAKHIRHNLNPLVLLSGKRRHSTISHSGGPVKRASKEKEVMCSCPPFECNCKQRHTLTNVPPPNNGATFSSLPSTGPFPQGGPVTQINITNTCLPPSNLGVNIPYSTGSFLPTNTRIYHANTMVREDINHLFRYGGPEVAPPHPGSPPNPVTHYHHEEFKPRYPPAMSYPEFQQEPHERLPYPTTIHHHEDSGLALQRTQTQTAQSNFPHVQGPSVSPVPSHIKTEQFEPNFLMTYKPPTPEMPPPSLESREPINDLHQPNPNLLPDFNALSFCPPPECHILHHREHVDPVEPRSDEYRSYQTLDNQLIMHSEHQIPCSEPLTHDLRPSPQQPTFITLTSLDKCTYDYSSYRQNEVSPHPVHPTPSETPNCPTATHTYPYNPNVRVNSTSPPHLLTEPALTHYGNVPHDVIMPFPRSLGGCNELVDIPDNQGVSLHMPETSSTPPGHHSMPINPGQHTPLPGDMGAMPYYSGLAYTSVPPTSHPHSHPPAPPGDMFTPYCSDSFHTASSNPQTYLHRQQQQHQQQPGRNSINITLTYN